MMMLADTMHRLFPRNMVLSECTSKATFIQRYCCHVGLLLWRSLILFWRWTDVASPQGGALSLSLFLQPEPGSGVPASPSQKQSSGSLIWGGGGGIKPTVTIARLDMLSFDRICLPNCLHKVYSQQPVNRQPVFKKLN